MNPPQDASGSAKSRKRRSLSLGGAGKRRRAERPESPNAAAPARQTGAFTGHTAAEARGRGLGARRRHVPQRSASVLATREREIELPDVAWRRSPSRDMLLAAPAHAPASNSSVQLELSAICRALSGSGKARAKADGSEARSHGGGVVAAGEKGDRADEDLAPDRASDADGSGASDGGGSGGGRHDGSLLSSWLMLRSSRALACVAAADGVCSSPHSKGAKDYGACGVGAPSDAGSRKRVRQTVGLSAKGRQALGRKGLTTALEALETMQQQEEEEEQQQQQQQPQQQQEEEMEKEETMPLGAAREGAENGSASCIGSNRSVTAAVPPAGAAATVAAGAAEAGRAAMNTGIEVAPINIGLQGSKVDGKAVPFAAAAAARDTTTAQAALAAPAAAAALSTGDMGTEVLPRQNGTALTSEIGGGGGGSSQGFSLAPTPAPPALPAAEYGAWPQAGMLRIQSSQDSSRQGRVRTASVARVGSASSACVRTASTGCIGTAAAGGRRPVVGRSVPAAATAVGRGGSSPTTEQRRIGAASIERQQQQLQQQQRQSQQQQQQRRQHQLQLQREQQQLWQQRRQQQQQERLKRQQSQLSLSVGNASQRCEQLTQPPNARQQLPDFQGSQQARPLRTVLPCSSGCAVQGGSATQGTSQGQQAPEPALPLVGEAAVKVTGGTAKGAAMPAVDEFGDDEFGDDFEMSQADFALLDQLEAAATVAASDFQPASQRHPLPHDPLPQRPLSQHQQQLPPPPQRQPSPQQQRSPPPAAAGPGLLRANAALGIPRRHPVAPAPFKRPASAADSATALRVRSSAHPPGRSTSICGAAASSGPAAAFAAAGTHGSRNGKGPISAAPVGSMATAGSGRPVQFHLGGAPTTAQQALPGGASSSAGVGAAAAGETDPALYTIYPSMQAFLHAMDGKKTNARKPRGASVGSSGAAASCRGQRTLDESFGKTGAPAGGQSPPQNVFLYQPLTSSGSATAAPTVQQALHPTCQPSGDGLSWQNNGALAATAASGEGCLPLDFRRFVVLNVACPPDVYEKVLTVRREAHASEPCARGGSRGSAPALTPARGAPAGGVAAAAAAGSDKSAAADAGGAAGTAAAAVMAAAAAAEATAAAGGCGNISTLVLRECWYECPVAAGDVIHLVFLREGTDGGAAPAPIPGIDRGVGSGGCVGTEGGNNGGCGGGDGGDGGGGAGRSEGDVLVADSCNYLVILHPDVLVSPTRVGEALSCERRAVLQSLLPSGGISAPAAVLGSLKHELFARCLSHACKLASGDHEPSVSPSAPPPGGAKEQLLRTTFGRPLQTSVGQALQRTIGKPLQTTASLLQIPKHVENIIRKSTKELYGAGMTEAETRRELLAAAAPVADWMAAFIGGDPHTADSRGGVFNTRFGGPRIGTAASAGNGDSGRGNGTLGGNCESGSRGGGGIGSGGGIGGGGCGDGSGGGGSDGSHGRFGKPSSSRSGPMGLANRVRSVICSQAFDVTVRALVEAEEEIWSPAMGLKGFIDATVLATVAEVPELGHQSNFKAHGSYGGYSGGDGCGSGGNGQGVRLVTMPIELKTGKKSQFAAAAHRAQVMLYCLLLRGRYGGSSGSSRNGAAVGSSGSSRIGAAVGSCNNAGAVTPSFPPGAAGWGGLLVHLTTEGSHVEAVVPQWAELRPLVALRNRLALGIVRASSEPPKPGQGGSRGGSGGSSPNGGGSGDVAGLGPGWPLAGNGSGGGCSGGGAAAAQEGTGMAAAVRRRELPPLLQRPADCARCFQLSECMTYHLAAESGSAATAGLDPGLFEQRVGHLTAQHLQYFRAWDEMLDAEASLGERARRSMWRQSGAEKEADKGACLSSMVWRQTHGTMGIDDSILSGDITWRYRFTRNPALSPASRPRLTDAGISVGDCVIVSTDGVAGASGPGGQPRQPQQVRILTGKVVRITSEAIDILAQKPLRVPRLAAGLAGPDIEDLCSNPRPGIVNDAHCNQVKKSDILRIDRDELATGISNMRLNVLRLMIGPSPEAEVQGLQRPHGEGGRGATAVAAAAAAVGDAGGPHDGGDARRRALIVDLSPPRFAQFRGIFAAAEGSQLQPGECSQPQQHQQQEQRTGEATPIVVAGCDREALMQEYSTVLNADQRAAVRKVVSARDYALLLGMPGTGKTSTIAFVTRVLVARGASVLITAYTHSAVDNLLLKLREHGVPCLRVGATAQVHPGLRDCCLECEGGVGDGGGSGTLADALGAGDYGGGNGCRNDATSVLAERVAGARIVGSTCLGIKHPAFAKRRFNYCIVDEAGQITQAAVLGPLRCADTFVLVGDHYQLPPLIGSAAAASMGMGVSLFRRLAAKHTPLALQDLSYQYRMSADCSYLCNTLVYGNRLRCADARVAGQKLSVRSPEKVPMTSVGVVPQDVGGGGSCGNKYAAREGWLREVLLRPEQGIYFLDTDNIEEPRRGKEDAAAARAAERLQREWEAEEASMTKGGVSAQMPSRPSRLTAAAGGRSGGGASATHATFESAEGGSSTDGGSGGGGSSGGSRGSLINAVECEIVELLVWALHRSGVCGSEIGVICPYRSQLRLLQTKLSKRFPLVEANTIDRYQGRDKHVVIVSFVRSNAAGAVGELLRDWRRLNVALSRAKEKMILVGSAATLRGGVMLSAMLAALREKGWIYRLPRDAHKAYAPECPPEPAAASHDPMDWGGVQQHAGQQPGREASEEEEEEFTAD